MKLFQGLLGCLALCVTGAAAQSYPTKPIRVVVGYAPGGTVDFIARLVATSASEQLGQTLVVENRPGAAGVVGANTVAKAAPDGYTVLICASTELVLLPHLTTLPFEPLKELMPLVRAATSSSVVAVHPSVAAGNAKELLELAKAKGGLPYGTPGHGSASHIAFELLRAVSGIEFVHVAYKGGAQAIADLVGGQIPLVSMSSAPMVAHFRAGKARPLAVLQPERSSLFPDVPTFKEATGFDINASTSYGFMLPAKTPAPIVATLESAILKSLTTADAQARLGKMTLETLATGSQPFGEWLRSENAYNANAIKRIGMKLKLE
jgi:tripartite-type tricarboxylate transporter receptor subunit TctC